MQARKDSLWRQAVGTAHAVTVIITPGEGQLSLNWGRVGRHGGERRDRSAASPAGIDRDHLGRLERELAGRQGVASRRRTDQGAPTRCLAGKRAVRRGEGQRGAVETYSVSGSQSICPAPGPRTHGEWEFASMTSTSTTSTKRLRSLSVAADLLALWKAARPALGHGARATTPTLATSTVGPTRAPRRSPGQSAKGRRSFGGWNVK
jgi:hypothetical protein